MSHIFKVSQNWLQTRCSTSWFTWLLILPFSSPFENDKKIWILLELLDNNYHHFKVVKRQSLNKVCHFTIHIFSTWNFLSLSWLIKILDHLRPNFNRSSPDPRRREKISLNLYFQTSLWCLKRFYEGLKGLKRFGFMKVLEVFIKPFETTQSTSK